MLLFKLQIIQILSYYVEQISCPSPFAKGLAYESYSHQCDPQRRSSSGSRQRQKTYQSQYRNHP